MYGLLFDYLLNFLFRQFFRKRRSHDEILFEFYSHAA